ncbi:hypothetical protein P879_06935 [Paragonimus westermani]|uniref:Netrin receptor UNC5 n=1 Tax=Paragonimus westermani TaxID=34504 RepID=A0A8T0DJ22_9TREM|nr:hypothetical protein P879_06935 [Paragonimus westermani]
MLAHVIITRHYHNKIMLIAHFLFTVGHTATADSQKDLVHPNETHFQGVPFFIQHPKPLYYTMKDHPATIECVAEPVSHAVIECAEQAIPYKGPDESGRLKVTRLDSHNRPDPNGNRWRLELQIRAKEVEEWFDSYVCRCEAWNKIVELQRPKKVISRAAVVVEAYLERKFQLEPTPTELSTGGRLELSCIPPEGKPSPEVYWKKNGNRIHKDLLAQMINNGRTRLIIENTTIVDSGNYTCVADLFGVEYRYSTAEVKIFEPPKKIFSPLEVVNNQVEKTGKAHQSPSAEEVAIYAGVVLVLAAVLLFMTIIIIRRETVKSALVEWLLNPRCIQNKMHRRMEKNGKLSNNTLLLEDCKQTWITMKNTKETDSYGTRGAYTTIKLVPSANTRSYLIPNQHTGTPAPLRGPSQSTTVYDTIDSKEPENNQATSRSTRVSSFVKPTFPPLPPPPPPTLSYSISPTPDSFLMTGQCVTPKNLSGSSTRTSASTQYFFSGLCQPTYVIDSSLTTSSQHTVEVINNPMLCNYINAQSSEAHSSSDSTTNTTNVSSSKEDSGDNAVNASGPPPPTTQDRITQKVREATDTAPSVYEVYSRPGQPLTENSNGMDYGPDRSYKGSADEIRGLFNRNGGALHLPNSGISLNIPPNAIPTTGFVDVQLTVHCEDSQRPVLQDLAHGDWLIRLYGAPPISDMSPREATSVETNNLDDPEAWKELCVIGYDSNEGELNCQLEPRVVRLHTCNPQRYCMVGETVKCRMSVSLQQSDFDRFNSSENNKTRQQSTGFCTNKPLRHCSLFPDVHSLRPEAIKLLHLAAFGGPTNPAMDYNIRVYVLSATRHTLEHVKEVELRLDGRLLDCIEHFPFKDNGMNLGFQIRDVRSGWRSRLQTEKQEIPFRHIWSGIQTSMLHCSFSLEHLEPAQCSVSCNIVVFQEQVGESPHVLRLANDRVQVR